MKRIINFIMKKIKLRTLIVLIILLMFNSYAWFVYQTRVKGTFIARISSWDLEFSVGEQEITGEMVFDVDRIYPGMETYTKEIVANNKGETAAKLTYLIKSLTILGEEIEIDEDIEEKLQTDYPFVIAIIVSNGSMAPGSGVGQFIISLEWPYESGDDELDTEWGERAYEFYSLNPR